MKTDKIPPYSVIKNKKIVASCTSKEAFLAAYRLLIEESKTEENFSDNEQCMIKSL